MKTIVTINTYKYRGEVYREEVIMMELIIESISRVFLVGYYLFMIFLAYHQVKIRLLPNAKYVSYSNYVREKNRSQYKDNVHYYKSIFEGILIQLIALFWGMILIWQVWFTITSVIAFAFMVLEALLVNWSFPQKLLLKDWIVLYIKRVAGVFGDIYYVVALIALCLI